MAYDQLIDQAAQLRRDTFNAFVEYGESHLGGSFSMIEALIAIYEEVLQEHDKFILSKAHASFPMCLLLRKKGFKIHKTTIVGKTKMRPKILNLKYMSALKIAV